MGDLPGGLGHNRSAPRRRVHHPALPRLTSSHTPGFLGQEADDLALICAETMLCATMPYFSTNCLLNNHTMMPDGARPPSCASCTVRSGAGRIRSTRGPRQLSMRCALARLLELDRCGPQEERLPVGQIVASDVIFLPEGGPKVPCSSWGRSVTCTPPGKRAKCSHSKVLKKKERITRRVLVLVRKSTRKKSSSTLEFVGFP